MVDMIYVDSSNVQACGYNPETMELHVLFLESGEYVYSDVPETVFQDFLSAASKGSYLNRVIKPSYSYRRL